MSVHHGCVTYSGRRGRLRLGSSSSTSSTNLTLSGRPERKGRAQIPVVPARKPKLDPDVKLDDIAGMGPGFAGADLADLVTEAAIIATRREADATGAADFPAAVERTTAGTKRRTWVMNANTGQRVARHEIGHAGVTASSRSGDPVRKATIIPRSVGAPGVALLRPTEDRFLITLAALKERISAGIARGQCTASSIRERISASCPLK